MRGAYLQALPCGSLERLAGVLDTGETALDLLGGGPGDEVLFTLGDGRVGGIVPADVLGEGLQRVESRHAVGLSTWNYLRARQRDR